MLTRYKGPLKLKDWAFAIAKNDPRCARRGSRSLVVSPSSCMPCCDTAPSSNRRSRAVSIGEEAEPSSRAERRPREGVDDGADSVACGQFGRLRFQPSRSAPSRPHQVPHRARRERRHPTGVNIAHNEPPPLDPLEMKTEVQDDGV